MWGCGGPGAGRPATPALPGISLLTLGAFLSGCLYSLQSRSQSQEHSSGDRPRISHVPPLHLLKPCMGCAQAHSGPASGIPRECGRPLLFARRQDFTTCQARSPGSGGLALCPGSAPAPAPPGQARGCSCPPAAPALSWAPRMPSRCPEPWAVTDPSHTHPRERNKHSVGFVAPVPYAPLSSVLFKTKGTPTSLGTHCSSLGL